MIMINSVILSSPRTASLFWLVKVKLRVDEAVSYFFPVSSLQADVESGGLPPCEGAVNLAGENIMNPLRGSVNTRITQPD